MRKEDAWVKVLLILVLSLFLAAPALGQEPKEVAKIKKRLDQEKLQAGKLQSFLVKEKTADGGDRGRVIGAILINAPMAKVRVQLNNWEAMPEWVPTLNYYKVKYTYDTLPPGIISRRIIEGQLGAAFIKVSYPLEVTLHEGGQLEEWRMLTDAERAAWKAKGIEIAAPHSALKNVGGFGWLEPTASGEKTIYYYSPVMESRIPTPGAIINAGMKLSLPGYLEGIKKRVESGGTYKK
ncbi:MAG: hypothetical protein PHY31_01665 [Smithellaceae bacterium]|nr:hypothetical protein [Smithellaceae bacterium]